GRPHTMMDWKAQERMWRLKGVNQRQDIGQRIAHAVASVLPYAERDIAWHPPVHHRVERVELSRRLLTEQDVAEANEQADDLEAKYEAFKKDLEAHPEKRQEP